MDYHLFEEQITKCWNDRNLLSEKGNIKIIEEIIDLLDNGSIRVAEKKPDGWKVNEWVKKSIILYFLTHENRKISAGEIEYYDKIPLKKNFSSMGVRAVPQAVARYGSFLSKGVILMPSYVNIGAFIGENTMVDTWATVGSCAQIGKNVHLSGGVGIGGVLEPVQASPVIIEDNCFIGSRAIIVEGVRVEEGAVIAANVTITASTKVIDVTGENPVIFKGVVPASSVVVPGTYHKKFPAGEFQISCALIIGKRKASTDLKTSLNDALREFEIGV